MLSCTNVGKIICAPYILWWFHTEPLFSIQDKARRKMSGSLSIKKSKQKENKQKSPTDSYFKSMERLWRETASNKIQTTTYYLSTRLRADKYLRETMFFSSVSEKKYFFVEVSIRISWVCTLYNSMSLLFGRVFCCCPYILCCVFLFLLRSNFALFRMYMCLFTLIFLHRTKQFDGRYESFHTTR